MRKRKKRVQKFVDKQGNEYSSQEVVYVNIDTPGPQFLGWVTRQSYKRTNCIDDWVVVEPV